MNVPEQPYDRVSPLLPMWYALRSESSLPRGVVDVRVLFCEEVAR